MGLLHGIGTRLDRQVIGWRGRVALALAVGLLLWTGLPLPGLLLATPLIGRVVLFTGLIALITLPPALLMLGARLVVGALLLMAPLLAVIAVGGLIIVVTSRVIGQHLAADTHTEHANCSQTPDAQFHAVSH